MRGTWSAVGPVHTHAVGGCRGVMQIAMWVAATTPDCHGHEPWHLAHCTSTYQAGYATHGDQLVKAVLSYKAIVCSATRLSCVLLHKL
mmetsp:Transcript_30407/g.67462  ORF Transcript_30407/g.67462 Transcript_30407/m.67462 type:complete len:88 (-) Transcript_30407:2018-2281(-)